MRQLRPMMAGPARRVGDNGVDQVAPGTFDHRAMLDNGAFPYHHVCLNIWRADACVLLLGVGRGLGNIGRDAGKHLPRIRTPIKQVRVACLRQIEQLLHRWDHDLKSR